MKPLPTLLTLLALTTAALATAPAAPAPNPEAAKNMKAFPAPAPGQARFVLQLPQLPDEDSAKLELIVGKTVQTDAVNHYFFAGKIEAQNIEGWGFTRYVVSQLGPMSGTLMAPPPNSPKIDRFVPLAGEPFLIRYNSKLPVVVYTPQDAQVQYRIWSAPPKTTPIPQN